MTEKLNGNRLLALLSEADQRKIISELEPIVLNRSDDLYLPNKPILHVYFVTKGVASIVKNTQQAPVEVATVGPEGMIGIARFLGSATVDQHAFVQVPGAALRIKSTSFESIVVKMPKLHSILARYTLALLGQIAQSAACNRFHDVDARCARWLLMTHDRVGEDSFQLTHEFLAQMLGVHRPTVSLAANMLQKAGLIRYARGLITITDRKNLERASCDCYRAIIDEYEKLLGHASAGRRN